MEEDTFAHLDRASIIAVCVIWDIWFNQTTPILVEPDRTIPETFQLTLDSRF
jgi:hypothetical protein